VRELYGLPVYLHGQSQPGCVALVHPNNAVTRELRVFQLGLYRVKGSCHPRRKSRGCADAITVEGAIVSNTSYCIWSWRHQAHKKSSCLPESYFWQCLLAG